jgi:beta-glucosidase
VANKSINENPMKPNFFWGVATSAFQLEGSAQADWALWDPVLQSKPYITHHYRLFREDLKLLKELGVNAYRFSVEWSRIQPEEDQWNDEAIHHYQEIVQTLRQTNIEPMVTLHHFTHPQWFLKKYPWHGDQSVAKFLNYIEKVVSFLKNVRYWITFNEPYVLLLGGYLEGCMPPGIQDFSSFLKALKNILYSHQKAYDLIHSITNDAMVSIAHNMATFAPSQRWSPFDRLLTHFAQYFYNHSLLDAFLTGRLRIRFPFVKSIEMDVPLKGKLDFFGVNYYTRIHLKFNPFHKMGVELKYKDEESHGFTDMGWEIHPHGMERVLREVSKLSVPIIVTENGIATHDDHKKERFIKSHVDVIEGCLKKQMDIRGYFYWSLMDNYEWLRGFDARFGLYRVDYETLKRKPTIAAAFYSYIIKSRSLF